MVNSFGIAPLFDYTSLQFYTSFLRFPTVICLITSSNVTAYDNIALYLYQSVAFIEVFSAMRLSPIIIWMLDYLGKLFVNPFLNDYANLI